MTKEQAQKELFNLLNEEEGAMIPIGYVDNLLNKVYKEFEAEKEDFEEKTKKKAYEGYLLMSKCAEQALEELKHERDLKDYIVNSVIKDLKTENKTLKERLDEYNKSN